jgi:hypothetical protein
VGFDLPHHHIGVKMDSPFNRKLHKFLISKGYKYIEKERYDRYDNDGITIFYYMHDYIVIIDKNGEPVPKEISREILEIL